MAWRRWFAAACKRRGDPSLTLSLHPSIKNNSLAEYVPNLTQSKTVPKPTGSKANVRLFQARERKREAGVMVSHEMAGWSVGRWLEWKSGEGKKGVKAMPCAR